MPKIRKPKGPAAQLLVLGKKLAELRRSVGLTQEAVAALVPVSVPALIKIENGDETLERLARALAKAGAVKASERKALEVELLTRKYAEHRTSEFLRGLARKRLKEING
jgi:transcriptional regulator with XRE-family HTH domain